MKLPVLPHGSRLRALALVSLSLAATVALSTPAGAADAKARESRDAQSKDIQLTTDELPAMRPGETAWVSTLWTADNRDADNFQMTAESKAATVSYPENTGKYSSFYGSSTLDRKATDFAALKVSISPDATEAVTLFLNATYDLRTDNGKGNEKSEPVTRSLEVTIPVEVVKGDAITTLTKELTPVKQGDEAWQEFAVQGEKPGVTELRLLVDAPDGIAITYPADADNAQPNESSTLDVGETDYFAFKTTVGSDVKPGTYDLNLTMVFGDQKQSATIELTVT